MNFPTFVKIVEVGPRDGLQNEETALSAEIKIELINRLVKAGLQVIEVGSFVSPKWVPQLADSDVVFRGIHKKAGVAFSVLVPNMKGFENALAVGATDIAVFTTPSEQFSQKNTNCSVAESMERIKTIVDAAKQHQIRVRAYLSCVLGCPFEGAIAPEKVAVLAQQLYDLGCYEISLGDTIGVGTPLKTKQLITIVSQQVAIKHLAVHFHDTYGQALANIFASLELGIAVIDSSVAGLGGCPYAKGATGNVATEDVLYMLNGMGIQTGVDLAKLIKTGQFICQQLNRRCESKAAMALANQAE